MENSVARPKAKPSRMVRYLILFFIVIFLGLVFIAYQTWFVADEKPTVSFSQQISQDTLGEQYGLQVRLIGVTAGGGMIDFRLKVVDPEKANLFLKDPDRKPGLWIEESEVLLQVPQMVDEERNLETGGIVFFLVPNTGGIVQPGTSVIVTFGDLALETILAQ